MGRNTQIRAECLSFEVERRATLEFELLDKHFRIPHLPASAIKSLLSAFFLCPSWKQAHTHPKWMQWAVYPEEGKSGTHRHIVLTDTIPPQPAWTWLDAEGRSPHHHPMCLCGPVRWRWWHRNFPITGCFLLLPDPLVSVDSLLKLMMKIHSWA